MKKNYLKESDILTNEINHINRIKDCIDELEKLKVQKNEIFQRLNALYRKRYPQSNRMHIDSLRARIKCGQYDKAKEMLQHDKIVWTGP